ncbi:MAG TPA: hypothetical protein VMS22_22360 [Candidatus Eisenbacteria bacterium]|nr:hypothetical protein [Candidatus Eisenbacteria bacterium]
MAVVLDRHAVAEIDRAMAEDRTMPPADAIARRLGAASWTLTFASDGRLRAVTVLADEVALRLPEAKARVPEPPKPPLERMFALRPDGGLAKLLGGREATGRQLVDLALRQTAPEIRAEAARVAVEAAMKDPELERMLLGALEGVDDRTLAQGLTGVAGDGAIGLLSLVAEQARGRPLGTRAGRLLVQLGVTGE